MRRAGLSASNFISKNGHVTKYQNFAKSKRRTATILTRNSAIADKPRDAFKGQTRSPNMVGLALHMLVMVSY